MQYLSDRYDKAPRDYQAQNLDAHRAAFRAGLTKFITNASVGAGKTLMIAELSRAIMKKWAKKDQNHYAILCLARTGELISQNAECAQGQGVKCSIWSASLNVKSKYFPVIFSTEKSFFNALHTDFNNVRFDFLMIDECHQVPVTENESNYMEIINELLARNPKMIISGFTGSPYRGIDSIVGDFWEKQIQDVNTDFLIDKGFLVPPHFGFPSDDLHAYNFNNCGDTKMTRNGDSYIAYDESKLAKTAIENKSLTHEIMSEVVAITSKRAGGCLIFCASKKHCQQAAEMLHDDSYGIITDSTPYKQRTEILDKARNGDIKYVFNLQCLTTGVDVPRWDTVVFLRPIGSLVLLIQSIGRVLRLCEDINKQDALVLDYAGVMERLGAIYDGEFISKALKEKAKSDQQTTLCSNCEAVNSMFARRCFDCGHWFIKPKICPKCDTKNDITARSCSECGETLIDWNKALYKKAYTDGEMVNVKSMQISVDGNKLSVFYNVESDAQPPPEVYYPWSEKDFCRKMFKVFLQKHINSYQLVNKFLKMNASTMVKMQAMLSAPAKIGWRISPNTGRPNFKKLFKSGTITKDEDK